MLIGECQKIFMAAVFAFHAGKAVVEITAVQMPVDDLLEIGMKESIGSTVPRRLGERFQNDPPHTGNNRKIEECADGKKRQERP